ncbi:hypothetical protein [Bacillus andreraoultii]|uniref:hypothetical protein n=1 Tax=Bacillus andreraoultii TaxID=1499685 RepID=UPI00053A3277|nr:hypothetical protein [Bacillus andreraoultii]
MKRWRKKREARRKLYKENDRYTLLDFILDVLFWIPEVIVWPFRLLFWLIRGLGRLISNLYDAIF